MPTLEFLSDPRQGERFVLEPGRVHVGRHPDCELVLDLPSVSRQHAALSVSLDGVLIEDLRSRNGTLVNGVPLSGVRRLLHGDEVLICGQRLVFTDASVSATQSQAGCIVDTGDEADEPAFAADSNALIFSQLALPRLAGDESLGKHAEAKLRAVLAISRAIGASVSVGEVLPRLLDGLLEVFSRADRGFVLLAQQPAGKLLLRARRLKRPDDSPIRLSRTLIDRVASTGQAILSADAACDTRFQANESVLVGRIRSVMCVPVTGTDGRLLGVVQIDSRDVHAGFDDDDLEVLAGVAGRAAQAIEQALAHEQDVEREQLNRDLEIAHRVQQGLLPSRPPELPDYEIFDFYEAARHVGGDFFAYVPLAGNRLAVVLADVSGKGVAAALLMAALSADVRYCLASEPNLAAAVSRINESFLRGGWDDRFATLVVAVLDPASHAVTICNAGHLPVFMRSPTGDVREVSCELGGLPLGMHAGHEYRSCTVDLEPGEAFLLCTDGVTEAMDHEGRCYGIGRLEQVIAKPAATATGLGNAILADVDRHAAGAAGSDDVCLVCVWRTGKPPA